LAIGTHRRSDALRLLFPKILSYSNLYPACTEDTDEYHAKNLDVRFTKGVVVFSLCKAKLFGCCGSFLFGAWVVRKQLGIPLVEKRPSVLFY
jgi:hypothetical protein